MGPSVDTQDPPVFYSFRKLYNLSVADPTFVTMVDSSIRHWSPCLYRTVHSHCTMQRSLATQWCKCNIYT